MFSSNTETGITATYQDGDGTIDLVVGTLNQNTTGTAATVTGAAQTAITSLGTLTALTGGTGDLIWDTPTFVVDSSANKVGIGTTSPLEELDLVGQFISANNKTDDTDKQAIFLAHQYDSGTETEGFMMMETYSGSSVNRVDIGGGHSGYNAATEITFNTAANNTTRTGSERMVILANGNVGVGTTSPSSKLHVYGDKILVHDAAGSGGEIFGYDDQHGIHWRVGGANKTIYYSYGDTKANGGGHNFYTGGMKGSQDLKLQIANNGTYVAAKFSINVVDTDYRMQINGSGTTMNNGTGACLLINSTDNTSSMIMFGCAQDVNTAGIGYTRTGSRLWLAAGGGSENPDSDAFVLTGAGKVGIGTNAPAKMLHLYSTTSGDARLRLDISGTGSDVWDLYSTTAGRLYVNAPAYGNGVYIQHNATSWTANSDETLKENITSLGTVGDKLKNYRTSYFTWKDDVDETPSRRIGFIGQDWEDDFPEVVNKVEGEPIGMQYTETIPILLKYIQELEARLTAGGL
jgi:hypothetical protein